MSRNLRSPGAAGVDRAASPGPRAVFWCRGVGDLMNAREEGFMHTASRLMYGHDLRSGPKRAGYI